MRSKKELLALEIWELTPSEHAWVYPDQLCFDHYCAVERAVKEGKPVPPKVRAAYPSLNKKARAGRKEKDCG